MQSLAALASMAASRRTSAMCPKYWLRCCCLPSCCTHHMAAAAAKSCGQAVRFDPSFSCRHEAGSSLKRCLLEIVPEAVTTGSHGACPSRLTSVASGSEMGAAALRRVGGTPVARGFEAIHDRFRRRHARELCACRRQNGSCKGGRARARAVPPSISERAARGREKLFL